MALGVIDSSTLSSIADAIREQGVEGSFTPEQMPNAIAQIEGGGGGMEKITLTGDIAFTCGDNNYQTHPFVAEHLHEWINPRCDKVTKANFAFYGMKNANVIKEINFAHTSASTSTPSMFAKSDLTVYPKLTGNLAGTFQQLFDCPVTVVTEDNVKEANILTTSISANSSGYWASGSDGVNGASMFSSCFYLKDAESLIRYLNSKYRFTSIAQMYRFATSIEKAVVPMQAALVTTSTFTQLFYYTPSLKEIEFIPDKNHDKPYLYTSTAIAWDTSTSYIGYYPSNPSSDVQEAGFTTANRVTDAASYERLKDGFWWSSVPEYSKWNLDSATKFADTIPTLVGNTGTITFNGAQGSGYGKGISNLSDETIAKYVEKGWTVAIK